jgi:acetyl-CoA C-acetyltransferase
MLIDTMINDGLTDSFNNYHMGVTAENIANKYKISRDEQDQFALYSQVKAQKAISENKFIKEVIKIEINIDKKKTIFETDEYPRSNLNLEDLKKLKTVFKENGTVTAGNSSGINDGAAATILMSRKEAELRSIEPLATIVSWATCGVEPSLMGLGPIPAVRLALARAKWNIEDIDLFEINEAFAAQSIAVIKDLGISKEIVNVNGGAIALGHPIGASGTRILVTLIHEMIKQNKSKGCATLCIGGGMGIAICIERA